jgi:tellurite resistance-related uncharacterized protein
MYDDGWVYSKPGKFKGGDPMAGITGKVPLPTKDAPMANPENAPGNLMQTYRERKDTYDFDPDTASMYDDGWVYSKPGKFKGGDPMAGITGKVPLPTKDAPMANPENAPGNLMQKYRNRKDTYDFDPDTASMYDDGWVYSKPGKFKGGDPMAGITGKVPLPTKDAPMANPENAPGNLLQTAEEIVSAWPSVARCADGKTSTDFEACDHMNNQEHQHDAIPPSQHAQIQLESSWPSVARCADGKTSTDFEACDHMNNQEHQHDAIPPSQHAQVQL